MADWASEKTDRLTGQSNGTDRWRLDKSISSRIKGHNKGLTSYKGKRKINAVHQRLKIGLELMR